METQSNNLDTFKILFIIKAVFNLFGALFFLGYGFFMSMVFTDAATTAQDMPFNISNFIGIIAGLGFILCLVFAIVTFLAGRYLGKAKNYTFILVVSILNCLTGISGILLGIFTILEINKPHVKVLFEKA